MIPAFVICLSLDKGFKEGLKAWLYLVLDEDKNFEKNFENFKMI